MERLRATRLKGATARTFRHSLAAHLIGAGYDSLTAQKSRVHKDVRTTTASARVLNRGGSGVISPADCGPPDPETVPDNVRALSRRVSENH